MFDLVIILSFEKGRVHHPPDLFPQSEHELQAAEEDADTGDNHDGSDYDGNQHLESLGSGKLTDDEQTNKLVLSSELSADHKSSTARPSEQDREKDQEPNHVLQRETFS